MFTRPSFFQQFLSHNNFIDQIYKALESDDLSDVVITALDILRKTYNLPTLPKVLKNDAQSTVLRNLGNNEFKAENYQQAMILYNKALSFAPKNSRAMKLAFSNRSALLHKVKKYKESLIDIEYCFSLGCPSDIIEKLKKRKEEINKCLNLTEEQIFETYTRTLKDKYFKCDISSSHCIGSDIEVIKEGMPKVVAANNIKVGTVLACERAFVSFTDVANSNFSCFFCQKVSLNLIPCDGCCIALFCNKDCKDKCMNEYHKYECMIMEALSATCFGPMPNLMIKACLKLRLMCKSWEEFNDLSYSYGIKKIMSGSVEENFDYTNKFSILCQRDDKPFVYGVKYNASFVCAATLHYMDKLTPLLDKSFDKKETHLRAFGRIMMFLSIYQSPLHLLQPISNNKTGKISIGDVINNGLFAFTGKLKKLCSPNVLVFNINNEVALIASKPIAKGEELTISYNPHMEENIYDKQIKNVTSFLFHGSVCSCINCNRENTLKEESAKKLTDYQKRYYSKLNTEEIKHNLNGLNIAYYFEKISEALEVLNDVPNSNEYDDLYKLFKKCMVCFETAVNENIFLDDNK